MTPELLRKAFASDKDLEAYVDEQLHTLDATHPDLRASAPSRDALIEYLKANRARLRTYVERS